MLLETESSKLRAARGRGSGAMPYSFIQEGSDHDFSG